MNKLNKFFFAPAAWHDHDTSVAKNQGSALPEKQKGIGSSNREEEN